MLELHRYLGMAFSFALSRAFVPISTVVTITLYYIKLSEPSLPIYCKLLESRDGILVIFLFSALWTGAWTMNRTLNRGWHE